MPESTKLMRVKRVRTQFTVEQLSCMEDVFSRTQYPDVNVLESLAADMDLAIEKVCTWFQNRRSKFRKENKRGHIAWMRQQFITKPVESEEVASVIPSADFTDSRNTLPSSCDSPGNTRCYGQVSQQALPLTSPVYVPEEAYSPVSPSPYNYSPEPFYAPYTPIASCDSSPQSPPEKRPDCLYDGGDITEQPPIILPSYEELYSFSYPLHSWIDSLCQPVTYQKEQPECTVGMLYNHSYAILDSS